MSSHIEKRSQTFKVRDTDITILADAYVDDKTNGIVFDRQLDNKAINMAFEQYRAITILLVIRILLILEKSIICHKGL